MRVITFLLATLCSTNVYAADLIVEEFGLPPTYSTIQSAVDAASDGDRIIIKNRTGNIPWVEDISIDKNLKFLSYENDDFFIVQGNYNITSATGRDVTIIGMNNKSGSVTATSAVSGTKGRVNIFDSHLENGNLLFDANNWEINIVGNQIDNGYVKIRNGNVIGNSITYSSTITNSSAVYIANESTVSDDTIRIIGNMIEYTVNTTSAYYGIYWISNTRFFDIRNNFIKTRTSGIFIQQTKNSANTINKIYNNSVMLFSNTQSATYYGIYVSNASSSNAIVEVMNNIIDRNASSTIPTYRGINRAGTSGQVNCYYNFVDNQISASGQINGNYTTEILNTTDQQVTLDETTGALTGGVGVDAANPSNVFYDLDLSPGDVGAYGGSFTLNNFFPLFTGAARVYFVNYPFNVRQGNTINIKANSFDR